MVAVIAAITIIAIQSCKDGKVAGGRVLKFDPEKGKQYEYEIGWELDQQMMEQNHQINITSGYLLDVIDEKDNIKTLRATYRSFKMYMNIMGMEIKVDTDQPSEPVEQADLKANPLGRMDKIFAGIKGKEFIMKVDDEGKVLEVSGFDKIVNEMIDSIGMEEDAKLQVQASLQDQFNGQVIKDQFAQVFSIFPGKEIKTGDSWEKTIQTGGRMPADYTTKYTVKEMEGEHITLTAQTNIKQVANSDMEIKGVQNGHLLVQGTTGLILSAEFDQDIATKSQGIDITIRGKGKIKGKAK